MRITFRVIWVCIFWLSAWAATFAREPEPKQSTTDLEDFVVYEEPRIMDGLRKRPFTRRDPIIEYFFHSLPEITREVYRDNMLAMETYFTRAKSDMDRKLTRLSELAGLESVPAGLKEGYEERIDSLETLLKWMKKEKPIQLEQLDIWTESDLRYRLARVPIENIRLNPQTDQLESRLLLKWQMLFLSRPRSMDLKLEFDMGIQLQEQTGYYDPKGFLQWSEIHTKDLKVFRVTYPIIITNALRENTEAELPKYLAAYRTTMNSFYQIIKEFFFSDLADVHTLYILTRGRIFSDEWRQYQSTPLQRGLAAQLVFQSMEERIGRDKALEVLDKDWTTWNLRKIGPEFNSVDWEGKQPLNFQYGAYKQNPNLRNIYWSTRFARSLADQYGATFIAKMCQALREQGRAKKNTFTEADIFRKITGDDLDSVTQDFLDKNQAH